MMATEDHLAQAKIGLFKEGGQYFCCRNHAYSTLDSSNPSFVGHYLYDRNRLQFMYPPPKRITLYLEILAALSKSLQVDMQG